MDALLNLSDPDASPNKSAWRRVLKKMESQSRDMLKKKIHKNNDHIKLNWSSTTESDNSFLGEETSFISDDYNTDKNSKVVKPNTNNNTDKNNSKNTNYNNIKSSNNSEPVLVVISDSESVYSGASSIPSAKRKTPSPKPKVPRKPSTTLSKKSDLIFPVSRILSILKSSNYSKLPRISKTSAVFMTAVLEYICNELILISRDECFRQKRKRVKSKDIFNAIKTDNEFSVLFQYYQMGFDN